MTLPVVVSAGVAAAKEGCKLVSGSEIAVRTRRYSYITDIEIETDSRSLGAVAIKYQEIAS